MAYSETYNQLLADEVTRRTGLGWETRERGRRRNRRIARELAGVPDALIAAFSQRSADIEAAVDTAVDRHVQRTGRQPSTRSLNRIRQHITLATRDRKKATSAWPTPSRTGSDTARAVLGAEPDRLGREPRQRRGPDRAGHAASAVDVPDAAGRQAVAARVVDAVAGSRSTWTRWNLTAETMRQITARGWQFTSTADTVAVRDRIVAAAEELSASLTAGGARRGAGRVPGPGRRQPVRPTDGVHLDAGARRRRPAAHPRRGPVRARGAAGAGGTDRRGSCCPAAATRCPRRIRRRPRCGIVTSGRVVDVLVGPAGTGKTTSMAGVRAMWEAEYGPGSVLGLAPSAKAAQVLAADLGIATDNTAQWRSPADACNPTGSSGSPSLPSAVTAAGHGRADDTTKLDAAIDTSSATEFDRWRLQPGQLLIVDEAGMAGTFALAELAEQARSAGAKLLLVGDPCQLSAVETGGAFGLLASARPDTPTLTVVRRFIDPDGTRRDWEEHAAAGLRTGDESAANEYVQARAGARRRPGHHDRRRLHRVARRHPHRGARVCSSPPTPTPSGS